MKTKELLEELKKLSEEELELPVRYNDSEYEWIDVDFVEPVADNHYYKLRGLVHERIIGLR